MNSIVLKDVINAKIKLFRLPHYWYGFIPVIPQGQFTMQVSGAAGSGKSTFALKFADTLAMFGDVLYCNFEEDLRGGTIQKKARLTKINRISKIHFLPDNILSESFEENYNFLTKLLDTGKFRYCIIDSLSEIVSGIAEEKKLVGLRAKYPDISFIYLFHVEKISHIYLGSSKSIHRVDIVVNIVEGVASVKKNRYQIGIKANELHIFK